MKQEINSVRAKMRGLTQRTVISHSNSKPDLNQLSVIVYDFSVLGAKY